MQAPIFTVGGIFPTTLFHILYPTQVTSLRALRFATEALDPAIWTLVGQTSGDTFSDTNKRPSAVYRLTVEIAP